MAGYEPSVIPPQHVTFKADGGAVETQVLVSSPVSTPGPNATVEIIGVIRVTPGTAATEVNVIVRRNVGTTGSIIGNVYQTVVAGGDYTVPFNFTDIPGDVAGEFYTLTVVETSATAPGTVAYATIGGYVF